MTINEHTKQLFAAIIDKKPITHNSGLKVKFPEQGDACLILHDDNDYSRQLSFIEVIKRSSQFNFHSVGDAMNYLEGEA